MRVEPLLIARVYVLYREGEGERERSPSTVELWCKLQSQVFS